MTRPYVPELRSSPLTPEDCEDRSTSEFVKPLHLCNQASMGYLPCAICENRTRIYESCPRGFRS